ncbi:hypothetical protein FKM82_006609 [Ascaphus truei]
MSGSTKCEYALRGLLNIFLCIKSVLELTTPLAPPCFPSLCCFFPTYSSLATWQLTTSSNCHHHCVSLQHTPSSPVYQTLAWATPIWQ